MRSADSIKNIAGISRFEVARGAVDRETWRRLGRGSTAVFLNGMLSDDLDSDV